MTVCVEHFKEPNNYNHWDSPNLEGYIYKDVFEESFYQKIRSSVVNIIENNSTKTDLTHGTQFTLGNDTKKIISHATNFREQFVLYDMTFDEKYYYQTPETIKQYSDEYIFSKINPIFIKYLKLMESLEPMKSEKDKWVPYRLHLNKLDYYMKLCLHIDANYSLFKCVNGFDARVYSVTYYLDDHEENYGGELYSINGFVYKPKKNSAILINGNQVCHGVSANMNPKKNVRLAFTTRWAHIDDLYLPGTPDKFLYNILNYTNT